MDVPSAVSFGLQIVRLNAYRLTVLYAAHDEKSAFIFEGRKESIFYRWHGDSIPTRRRFSLINYLERRADFESSCAGQDIHRQLVKSLVGQSLLHDGVFIENV